MRKRLVLVIALFGYTGVLFGQQTSNWEKWSWLIGEWHGEGSGEPGKGGGTFSFTKDLNENILVRKSHSEYPATDNSPGIVHEDLMIIYLDQGAQPSQAIYFDNEGHTIHYMIVYDEKSIVLTSEKTSKMPVFRLTYTFLSPESIHTKFEMSQDGQTFMTYIEGASNKSP